MGYLPGFDVDVFISYAHNDDDKYGPEDRGWVAQLHVDLAERIKTYLNETPQLWRDCDITGNDDFVQKIANRLTRTATLLSVISDNFLNRPWCRREVEEFCLKAGQAIQVGEKRRIFKAERRPVSATSLPKQLEGTGMYRFYVPNPGQPNAVRELRPSLGLEVWRLYFEQIDSLARDIAETLKTMRTGTSGVPRGDPDGGTVYLAETTSDQEHSRDQIRKDLQDRRFTVLPEGDLSSRGPQFEQQVREYLKKSDVSIHIFGSEYGFVPEGRDRPHTWLQHDLALERARDPDFRRIVWLPSVTSPSHEGQRQYLDYLRSDVEVQKGAEILYDKLEDLKAEALKAIDEVRARRQQPAGSDGVKASSAAGGIAPAKPSDGPPSVYLICDAEDRRAASFAAVQSYLFECGFEPLEAEPADDVEDARRIHEDLLQVCDAWLIYYGAASDQWAKGKLQDFIKVRNKRQRRLLSTGVYVAPPLNDSKAAFRTNLARVIVGGESFSPEQLTPFLAALGRS
jgi:hypothetical protein